MAYAGSNSPAVKRLAAELRELTRNPAKNFTAEPLEDELFEWHFTITGPPGTSFEGGRYHGRIIMPPEYPMKPPDIYILTPNGVQTSCCLTENCPDGRAATHAREIRDWNKDLPQLHIISCGRVATSMGCAHDA